MPTSQNGHHRNSVKVIFSYVLDWIVLIVVGVVSYIIGDLEPHKRPFSLTDPNISLPYSQSETVPLWFLGILAGAVPFAIILIVTLVFVPGAAIPGHTPTSLIWRRKLWELHIGTLGFITAHIIAFFFTQGMKNLFGKPRPDLLSRCQPDMGNAAAHAVGGFAGESMAGQLYSTSICQQEDADILHDGFRSYPSGHSSASAAGLVYLSLFLASKLTVAIPFFFPSASSKGAFHAAFPSRMAKTDPPGDKPDNNQLQSLRTQAAAPPLYLLALTLAPFALSIYISASRWFDFRHHGFDILFGYFIGLVAAIYVFRYYHLPISGGPGWAWGPRSNDRAFWAGVGRNATDGWKS
ncbi:phosphatidic acid phosphatase type 2/haloperoxidase [Aspergillus keveii]|uniref:Phosphatidic acid phosphatase type 2/haloperoxidase n=1 Tax=Aspergillus keveii TaxID=714993 RepID=A0ABR4FJV9_9EURO